MILSIIIVNYNVKHFLEQCLMSVRKALQDIESEVIIVDNNSVDGSVQMLQEKFLAEITLIANTDNPGFSKANNQGIHISTGKYILLLNPDTVVEENTFRICIDFMEKHPEAGALGVKMIDGSGKFLPESKRGFPTPAVSFYKIFGLSALFPRSKTFGKYHLSYLDKDENHAIEILAGAYMFMRKAALDKVGYLDEDFFMYGEDIDLSYRITQGGYENYYLADTKIIHYKGESTKKGSLNYVKVFYQAMIIFAKKHFSGSHQRTFIAMIQLAVYLRALGAVLYRFWQQFGFTLVEMGLFYAAIFGVKGYWEKNIKFIEGGEYPPTFDFVAAPIYTLVFAIFLWTAGAYKKPFRIRPLVTAMLGAFVGIATVSYIFPHINFSRAIVGISSVLSLLIAITTRGILHYREKKTFFFSEISRKRVVIVANAENASRILTFLQDEIEYPTEMVGLVSDENSPSSHNAIDRLGTPTQLPEIVRMFAIDEIVFCNKSISTETIISLMSDIQERGVEYKIVPPDADYIIGSQFIHTAREQRVFRPNLSLSTYKNQKRRLDFFGSFILLSLFPISFFLYKKPLSALQNLWQILTGKKHFVGYIQPNPPDLPKLKPAMLNMNLRKGSQDAALNPANLDKYYAKSYRWEWDLELIMRGFRDL